MTTFRPRYTAAAIGYKGSGPVNPANDGNRATLHTLLQTGCLDARPWLARPRTEEAGVEGG